MKTTINSFKKTIISMTAIFFLSLTTATFATEAPKDSNAVGLHFVGKVENVPVFRLVLSSDAQGEYIVKVKDANGDEIFSEKVKGSALSRMYKLDTQNGDLISGTTFEVMNKATNTLVVYTIKNTSKVVDDFTIAKL